MIGAIANHGHHALMVGWRYLPLWARRLAIRILYPRFPVGAVAIIRDGAGRVLLVRQTYHRREHWGAPGGWLKPGEGPRQAVARETLEEIGRRVRVGRVLAVGSGPFGEIGLAFECSFAEGESADDSALTFSDEVDRAAFFSPDRLPSLPRDTRRLLLEAFAAQAEWVEPVTARSCSS